MSDRVTRTEIERAFEILTDALGKELAFRSDDVRDAEGRWRAPVGAWLLDHNSAYGGYVIREYVNEGGGVTEPLGSRRRTGREFVDVCRFALAAIHMARTPVAS